MTCNLSRRYSLSTLPGALSPRGARSSSGAASLEVPANLRGHTLRGDDTARLPDRAALWDRMPLPFTPAEAWHLLSPATQAEIGAAVIGMALADYVSGDMHAEADHFHDDALRAACIDARDGMMSLLSDRLWSLFPDLYGPEDDHPAWALKSGMASPAT